MPNTRTCYIVAHAHVVDDQVMVKGYGLYSVPPWGLTLDLTNELAMMIQQYSAPTYGEAMELCVECLKQVSKYCKPLARLGSN